MKPYWHSNPTPDPPATSASTSARASGEAGYGAAHANAIAPYSNAEPVLASDYGGYAEPAKFHYDDVSFLPDLQRRDSVWSNSSMNTRVPLDVRGGPGGGYLVDTYAETEVPDSSYGSYGPPPPLTASSLTCSPRSSTISPKSGWSPIQTEFGTDFATDVSPASCSAGKSRVPSPLRNIIHPATDGRRKHAYGALVPKYEVCQNGEDLKTLARTGRSHICLWGDNVYCDSFASREELNWHVKSEHLLVCPFPGCTESTFETKDLVYRHVVYAHGSASTNKTLACLPSNVPEAPVEPSIPLADCRKGKHAEEPTVKAEMAKETNLKMEMSIGTSKRRCREQLRTVLEKKWMRANGSSKAVESPGAVMSRVPKLLESASFPIIWEHGVLPFLIEYIPKWCGPGHVISVMRGRKPNSRRICIMTRRVVRMIRKMIIAGHVRDLLPENHRNLITFTFSTGKVDRLVWARGLGKEIPDDVVNPRNPFCYISPCMGDSVGMTAEDGDQITATLGPCVALGDRNYWLVNLHPFLKPFRKASEDSKLVLTEHPSPADRATCLDESHDVLSNGDLNFRVGSLTATSGFDQDTSRLSHDPYWEDYGMEPPLIVTDWALISANTRQANMLRKFPTTTQRREVPVTSMASIVPGATVCSTGRTSGFQRGQVCEIPAYLDGSTNGTGRASREWYIEEPYPYDNEEEWIRGGIGVPGDSGAAVVDSESNALIGQLWGRNKYFGPGPRQTFFTPIFDIFDDIQERCGQPRRPQLPQYRDEADRWAVYPVCKQCFDQRSYRDSRRSSRESMISMIGLHTTTTPDADLTSVSELATPKDPAPLLHAQGGAGGGHLVRHVGAGDSPQFATPSFAGGASPAPTHTFFNLASPEAACARSPYAQALPDEDLYEGVKDGGRGEVVGAGTVGKRAGAALPLPMAQSAGGRQQQPLQVGLGSGHECGNGNGNGNGKRRRVG